MWLPLLFGVVPRSLEAASKEFYDTWSDGRGEVNTYELVEERYGQPREGHAVLVYAAEELDRNTYVKVESGRTPQNERMFVVKLNKLLRFPTGLYDYATMTTVFSVADSHLGHHPFQAARVSHTTQEWCGQVYHRLDLTEDGWEEELRSYFESEADMDRVIPARETDLEDNLFVWVRELDGEVLAPGESRELELYPSLWAVRKSHRPLQSRKATLVKGDAETYEAMGEEFSAYPWSWSYGDREVRVWVEAGGEKRVLGWSDSRGGEARLVHSERLVYWRLNGPEGAPAREPFGLPGDGLVR